MTEKEFRSVFDGISCSRGFTERMEQKLTSPKESSEHFADSVSGVEITRRSPIIRTSTTIAACLAFILIGFAAGTALNGGIPSAPISPSTVIPTEASAEETTEMQVTEQSTIESGQILYPGKEIPLYDEFPVQEFAGLSEEQLIEVGKKYYDAAYRLQHPNDAPPYLFFYAKKDELYVDENGLEYSEVAVDSVKTVEDVREDFYSVFTSDWDSSVIDKYFAEKDGKLYYRCENPHISIRPSDYVLELDNITETEIYFSYRITIENISLPEEERFENVTLPFTLKRTEEGWKVSVFMSPYDQLVFFN